mgnify:CR=1 FL=1
MSEFGCLVRRLKEGWAWLGDPRISYSVVRLMKDWDWYKWMLPTDWVRELRVVDWRRLRDKLEYWFRYGGESFGRKFSIFCG